MLGFVEEKCCPVQAMIRIGKEEEKRKKSSRKCDKNQQGIDLEGKKDTKTKEVKLKSKIEKYI